MKILMSRTQEKKCKILTDFYGIIADMIINKKFNPIVTELFFRRRKLKTNSCFYK